MSVELVNGYVLLPHAPDWNVKPQFRREWRTSIADGVTGAEDRLSFRHAATAGRRVPDPALHARGTAQAHRPGPGGQEERLGGGAALGPGIGPGVARQWRYGDPGERNGVGMGGG